MGTIAMLSALVLQGSTIALEVDISKDIRPISPYIYGTNQPDWNGRTKYLTFARQGGNRMTAYSWENNASNAGSDWFHQNDDYLGGGNTPAEVPRAFVAATMAAGAVPLITVPIVGYVAADKNGGGDVNQTPNYLDVRFRKNRPAKGAAFAATPDLSDAFVYQDEFVSYLKKKLNTKRPLWYSLDNEPDLWMSTHARIHPDHVSYQELFDRSKETAQAIKAVDPVGLIFGAVNYGWWGYQTLQDAPDAGNGFFLDWFLKQFKDLDTATGRRWLDVLDVHWYSEAQGGGQRITNDSNQQSVYDARVQASRSFYDPAYTEDSWISQWMTSGPIKLIPLLKAKIQANYPGTKLCLSEWSHGGGNHISGAIATADSLGAFGREGLFAATYWNLYGDERFVYGGFEMYRNFDGKGGRFGNTAVASTTGDNSKVAVYGSTDTQQKDAITIVVINRSPTSTPVHLVVKGAGANPRVTKAYRITNASSFPAAVSAPLAVNGVIDTTLPGYSITTLRLTRVPGDVNRIRTAVGRG